jgi:NAD+ diphosphatase
MIQDIAPHVFHNEFISNKEPQPLDTVFHFNSTGVCVEHGARITFPRLVDVPADTQLQFLFSLDDQDFYMARGDKVKMPGDFTYMGMRDIRRADLPKELIFAVLTAYHLAHWYRDNVYCGRCGTPTVPSEEERALDCPQCGRRIYPRINPAVIVAVTDGDRLLLTKYANRPISYYALVAGFTEIGETFEETVAREVMEEVGLKVKNIRYYKSQPWGLAEDILAGFYCDVDGDPTIRLDETELKVGKWFPRGEVASQPDDHSLTNEMMQVFKAGNEPK